MFVQKGGVWFIGRAITLFDVLSFGRLKASIEFLRRIQGQLVSPSTVFELLSRSFRTKTDDRFSRHDTLVMEISDGLPVCGQKLANRSVTFSSDLSFRFGQFSPLIRNVRRIFKIKYNRFARRLSIGNHSRYSPTRWILF